MSLQDQLGLFVQNSQEARAAKAALSDLHSSPEVVASKKNLFEGGEAWTQSPTKAGCKVSFYEMKETICSWFAELLSQETAVMIS